MNQHPLRPEPLSIVDEINRLREAIKAGYRLPSCVRHAVGEHLREFEDGRALHLYIPTHLLFDDSTLCLTPCDCVHVVVDTGDGKVLSMRWFSDGKDGNAVNPQHIHVHGQGYLSRLIIAAAIIHWADPCKWDLEQIILEPPA